MIETNVLCNLSGGNKKKTTSKEFEVASMELN